MAFPKKQRLDCIEARLRRQMSSRGIKWSPLRRGLSWGHRKKLVSGSPLLNYVPVLRSIHAVTGAATRIFTYNSVHVCKNMFQMPHGTFLDPDYLPLRDVAGVLRPLREATSWMQTDAGIGSSVLKP